MGSVRGFFFGVLVLVSFELKAQVPSYRVGAAPKWVVELPVPIAAVLDQHCVEGGVELLLLDRQYHLGEEVVYWRRATRLSTIQAVQHGSRFEMSFDPTYQQLIIHYLRVIRDGVVIEKFDRKDARLLRREADMRSFLYDGSYTVVLELTDVRVGDIIEEAVSIVGWNPVDGGRFHRQLGMGFSIPIGRNHLRVVVPKGRDPLLKIHGSMVERRVEVLPGGEAWVWDDGPLPCIQGEQGTPQWFNSFPWVEFSEFQDIDELLNWAHEQYGRELRTGGALTPLIAELREIPDVAARMDSAVALVQREIRYLGLEDGISAYRPHSPSTVFQQKYGDCKDKSLLLSTILRSVGIPAFPALVSTTTGHALEDNLPRPSLFDHCITVIPNDGDTLWVDPTSAHNGGVGAVRYTPYYGKALVIADGTKGLTTMMVRDQGAVDITEEITLDTLGGEGTLSITSEFRGGRADGMRAFLASRSAAELNKNFTDYYSGVYGRCEQLSPFSVSDDRQVNLIRVSERYRLLQPWDTINDGASWRFSVSASYVKDNLADPGTVLRTAPFSLGEPIEVRHLFKVKLPVAWNVKDSYTTRSGNGITFERDIRVTADGSAVIDHRYASTLRYVEAEEAAALHDLQKQISNDLYFEFTHPTSSVAPVNRIPWTTWTFILLSIITSLFIVKRMYTYDPLPDPSSFGRPMRPIGGFLILPAIGLCLSVIRMIMEMFKDDGWFFLMTSAPLGAGTDGAAFGSFYTYLSQFQGIVTFGFLLMLILLFFQRRSSIPIFMKVFYAWNLIWVVLDMTFYAMVDGQALTGEPYGTKEFSRALLAAAIWIPVFHLSERVKTTFTKQLGQMPMFARSDGHVAGTRGSEP